MSKKDAQLIEIIEEPAVIVEPESSGNHIVMYMEEPNPEVVMEMHDPDMLESLELSEDPGSITIEIGELAGVNGLDPELEKKLEVVEEVKEEESDADDSKSKTSTSTKWDWQSKGAKGFISWVKEKLDDIPKHSGYDTAGIERACSYLQKLDSEISKAMRLDLDGELDSDKIEDVRSKIDDAIERLEDRAATLVKEKKKRKKKASSDNELVKSAQKIAGVDGIVVTVPLLISGIVRTCINASVSAGHDLAFCFDKLKEKFKLNDREVFECLMLLRDMGYPVYGDRGYLPNESVDPTSSDNYDYMAGFFN